jgi:hypothetical protein
MDDDDTAAMVLEVMREVARQVTEGQKQERVLHLPEHTGATYDLEFREYVEKRSDQRKAS